MFPAPSLSRRAVLAVMGAAVLTSPLVGCGRDGAEAYSPDYRLRPAGRADLRFGCPFSTPEMLFSIYQPLIDHLNPRLAPSRLRLEASRDYESFERKLYYRNFPFALCNPYQAVMAVANGYRIFAKMDNDDQFHGLILVRRDGKVREPVDLVGRILACPAPSAVASAMLPLAFLKDQGVDVPHAVSVRYVGTEESAIYALLMGRAEAAATWPATWSRFQDAEPDRAARLDVRWTTPGLPSNALVARDDVDPDLVDTLRDTLTGLGATEAGRAVLDHLGLPGFAAADLDTYRPVLAFLRRFSDTVQPVALP